MGRMKFLDDRLRDGQDISKEYHGESKRFVNCAVSLQHSRGSYHLIFYKLKLLPVLRLLL